ncbi:MAG: MBL fold metallo-hydrolase [Eubacterium sp.]|nr:MBL fold metallo-hydrolase [Eubacterium sp.]
MNVLFLHHSCFIVELDTKVLVFDYFNGDRVNGYHFKGILPRYDADTPMYFFASHKHQDHFDMDIYRLTEYYENIHFIISKDAKLSPNFMKKHGIDPSVREKILYVSAGEDYVVDDMKIHTFLSTDAGVAFAVDADGKHIYHAGDLHNWKWEGAGDLINGKMERTYMHQINRMEDSYYDVAFVVLDPRLEQHKFKGFDYFLKHVSAKYVFPMHCWQQFSLIDEYMSRISNAAFTGRIMRITQENQIFEDLE